MVRAEGSVVRGEDGIVRGEDGIVRAEALADFGIIPSPRRPTVEVKAKAVAKQQATRKARNVMGSRQRAKVKGVVVDASKPAPAPTVAPTAPANGSTNGTTPSHGV
jgi:hypothetical protein